MKFASPIFIVARAILVVGMTKHMRAFRSAKTRSTRKGFSTWVC
jgi:hypothetical protein